MHSFHLLESLLVLTRHQIYLLRWVRLLLGREFHSLDDLMIIWDAVFAHSPDLVLVDYICVAMLVFIREQCMGACPLAVLCTNSPPFN